MSGARRKLVNQTRPHVVASIPRAYGLPPAESVLKSFIRRLLTISSVDERNRISSEGAFPQWWKIPEWWQDWPRVDFARAEGGEVVPPVIPAAKVDSRAFDQYYKFEKQSVWEKAGQRKRMPKCQHMTRTQIARVLAYKIWKGLSREKKRKYYEMLGDRRPVVCLLEPEQPPETPCKKKAIEKSEKEDLAVSFPQFRFISAV